MALVTVSGYPCSGKSTRTTQLEAHLRSCLAAPSYSGKQFAVAVISDESLNLPRSVYDESASSSEKPARQALFTQIQRQLSKDTILIVDAPNYIKGFRYQIFCAAKEAGVRVCTIFVATPPDKCKEWHLAGDEARSYDPATFDNLIMRFEEPNSMVRWDSPLFTISWDDESPPYDDVWKAVSEGQVQVANAGTTAAPKAPVDALQVLESTTNALVSAIISEQTNTGGLGGTMSITSPGGSQRIPIAMPPRNVTLAEMQRLKRQFVAAHRKAMTQGAMERGGVDWTEESVAAKFVAHIQEHLSRVS